MGRGEKEGTKRDEIGGPHESDYYESKIQSELKSRKELTNFKYPLTITTVVVPAIKKVGKIRVIQFKDKENKDKNLLHKLIVAAYNYAFFDKTAALTAKKKFSQTAHLFIDWLNDVHIGNRYKILKEYESHRFDTLNNHGGSSGLITLKTLFTYALDYSKELVSTIKPEQMSFLNDLRETKMSPNINKTQISLASYFGGLDWLRREDIGIGRQLYQSLASPKITINSLKVTASTLIIELYNYKLQFRKLLLDSHCKEKIPSITEFNKASTYEKKIIVGKIIYYLISYCYKNSTANETQLKLLKLVLLSNTTNISNFTKFLDVIGNKEKSDYLFLSSKGKFKGQLSPHLCDRVFNSNWEGNLFSLGVLYELASPSNNYPILGIEKLMFTWLMASLTVQPSDISKLTYSSFRQLKVGGEVRSIECEYFKGRAKIIHTTRSISTRQLEGSAIALYLEQHGEGNLQTFDSISPCILKGITSMSGLLYGLLNLDWIKEPITKAHYQNGKVPTLIPAALCSLIANGNHEDSPDLYSRKTSSAVRKKKVLESDSPCHKSFFGLNMIKNSAVHAYSDPYTLNYLTNYNSHSNKTEKLHYLNESNEEWMNSAGRITRNVMLDLINNVFNLGFDNLKPQELKEELSKFNSEFMGVSNSISYKTEEMLSRLKVVTDQQKGQINEVGIFVHNDRTRPSSFSPIYVLDSPVTAFKIYNYIHEFNNNYRRLLRHNPDYLYKTVIPTVEWMEQVLKELSKLSIKQGDDIFKKMKANHVSLSVFHSI